MFFQSEWRNKARATLLLCLCCWRSLLIGPSKRPSDRPRKSTPIDTHPHRYNHIPYKQNAKHHIAVVHTRRRKKQALFTREKFGHIYKSSGLSVKMPVSKKYFHEILKLVFCEFRDTVYYFMTASLRRISLGDPRRKLNIGNNYLSCGKSHWRFEIKNFKGSKIDTDFISAFCKGFVSDHFRIRFL